MARYRFPVIFAAMVVALVGFAAWCGALMSSVDAQRGAVSARVGWMQEIARIQRALDEPTSAGQAAARATSLVEARAIVKEVATGCGAPCATKAQAATDALGAATGDDQPSILGVKRVLQDLVFVIRQENNSLSNRLAANWRWMYVLATTTILFWAATLALLLVVRARSRRSELLRAEVRRLAEARARQSEEHLRLLRQDFRMLIETSPDAVAVYSWSDGPPGPPSSSDEPRLVYANLALADALQATCESLVGLPPERVTGEPGGERRVVRGDGSVIILEAGPVRSIRWEGAPAMVVVARDVTEHRKLEAQVRLGERMISLGTLAAGVAHEINNPLTAVIANLEALDARASGSSAAEPLLRGADSARSDTLRSLRDAIEGARRVAAIVRDLRAFAGSDERDAAAGSSSSSSSSSSSTAPVASEAPPRAVDLRRALDAACGMARHAVRYRAKLVRDDGEVPHVTGSEPRIVQLFLNLILNAAESIPLGDVQNHTIRVTARQDSAGRAVVEVSDDGAGIAAEHLGRIFDAFYTTREQGAGRGLGLFVCQGVASSVGGSITVESEPGRGSTFRVTLPAAPPDAVPAAPPRPVLVASTPQPAAPSDARRLRVLIIDDEPSIRRALARVLRRHEVMDADSGSEAIAFCAHTDFDVVLCDVMMPCGDGAWFHDQLRALRPGAESRIIFMTGGTFTEKARDFLTQSPNLCVEKPFDMSLVQAAVELTASRLPEVKREQSAAG